MKLKFVACLAFSALIFVSCKKEYREMNLVLAEVNPRDSLMGQMDIEFARILNEKTGGKIKIDLQTDGILGNEDEILKIMKEKNSKIAFARISAFSMTNMGGPKSALLTIPYTFCNKEHFWSFVNSPFAEEILDEPYKNKSGIKGLVFAEEGFRHFFGVQPIQTINDFAEKKVRVPKDPVMQRTAQKLGAKPIEEGLNNLLTSLFTGKMDIAEQPIVNYVSNSFHSVAPNVILDGHTLGVIEIVVSTEIWDSLQEMEKDAILSAAKEAAEFCKKSCEEREKNAIEIAIKEGTTFVSVSDKTPWQEACKEIANEYSRIDKKLYENILSLNK